MPDIPFVIQVSPSTTARQQLEQLLKTSDGFWLVLTLHTPIRVGENFCKVLTDFTLSKVDNSALIGEDRGQTLVIPWSNVAGYFKGYRAVGGQAGGGYCAFGRVGTAGAAGTALALAALALLQRRSRRAGVSR